MVFKGVRARSAWRRVARYDREVMRGDGAVSAHVREGEESRSVGGAFERQAARSPDRLALVGPGGPMTYGALNRAANRVAHAVLARPDATRAPIALVMVPGPAAIIALVGVLKAGGFYVPIDARQPRPWIASVLDDCRPSLLVTDRASRSVAASLAGVPGRLVVVDEPESEPSERNPARSTCPNAPAYVMYTSGSTGRPKGALHDHAHVLHQTRTYGEALGLGPDDCLTWLHSHAFSASRLDVFPALLSGATLCALVGAAELGGLGARLAEHAVTVLHWVPTAFAAFAGALGGPERWPRLRWVVLGSEPMLPEHVALHERHFATGARLLNRYGTTETGSIAWRVIDPRTEPVDGRLPVGRPVGDVDVLVLDAAGRSVPPDHVGEIAVRSRFGSTGYWRQPGPTAAAFVPDAAPRGSIGGQRIYRTGDLGRLSAEGELAHVGRVDFQVKVRGHRVELEAIERTLLEHPAIREAAVAVRGSPAEPRLTAYVVGDRGPGPGSAELRGYLEARLPSYMVPAAFVAVHALPRTIGGKVNRRVLPERDATPAHGEASAPPRGSVEEALARIWAESLGLGSVGVHDSFFDLGGHSLQAERIAARVVHAYGVTVPLRVLFESPTVAAMAKAVTAALARPR